mgnify:CR=1 FL=1
MRKLGARIGAFVFVLALVAAACGKSSNSSAGSPPASESAGGSPSASASASASASEGESGTMTIGSDTANDHGSKDVSGATSADVELDNYYFEPTVLTGTPGQQLTLNLDNHGDALHNFSITEQSVDAAVARPLARHGE